VANLPIATTNEGGKDSAIGSRERGHRLAIPIEGGHARARVGNEQTKRWRPWIGLKGGETAFQEKNRKSDEKASRRIGLGTENEKRTMRRMKVGEGGLCRNARLRLYRFLSLFVTHLAQRFRWERMMKTPSQVEIFLSR